MLFNSDFTYPRVDPVLRHTERKLVTGTTVLPRGYVSVEVAEIDPESWSCTRAVVHFSPDRAREIAAALLIQADQAELRPYDALA